MSRSSRWFALVLVALLAATPVVPGAIAQEQETEATEDAPPVDPELFSTMSYRSIGPLRGGRSTAVTGFPGRPKEYLMGSTGGGVWKSSDMGLSWDNVSDGHFHSASIGAIAVAPSDQNVIYVGTGSACIRGNATTGDGMYRSLDGGDTWKHVGLPDSGTIARLIVHPKDHNLIYAAVFGHPFGPNPERGVYRSRDGGDTWEQVKFVSDEVGAVDLSMNPDNPREMYAAFWRFERKPWTAYDGSEDGGIYKTKDGGDTWEKLGGGLPTGLTGRIGVSVSPADPTRVYALVSALDPEGGLYRSDDSGKTWQRINRDRNLRQRHWYYSHVHADPTDRDTVYVLNVSMWKSIDGGKSVSRLRPNHGDTHDLWINPDDPDNMILGDDGGGEVTTNGGASWSTVLNQPTAELYRVTVDNQWPYRVYAAQQDNSTLSLRSDGRGAPQDWYTVGGCESGHIAVDPRNNDIVYAGCYIGEISRYDHSTQERRPVTVYPALVDGYAPRDLEHRFQWNAPILISQHDPTRLYHTSQTVNRSSDEGHSWEVISPDLTRNDGEKQDIPGGPLQHDHTSVEVYGTVFALAESPHDAKELWAGSDDGLVHVSRDDGGTWENVTPPGLPEDGTVNTIDVSSHQPGKVTIAVHRYRMDDWTPYIFQTADGGATWSELADGTNGIPDHHPVRVVREDPDRAGLLYAGTEFGMFISFDDGARWQKFQLNLPVTSVVEMLVHEQDLVVATQGRSIWILDDVTPLHHVDDALAAADSGLLPPRDAIRTPGGGFFGARNPYGTGGTRNAALIYKMPAGEDDEESTEAGDADDAENSDKVEVKLEVLDAAGNVVRSWISDGSSNYDRLDTGTGMHRQMWDLRHTRPDILSDGNIYLGYAGGPAAVPGEYTARLIVGETTHEQPITLRPDPRRPEVSTTDLQATYDMSVDLAAMLGRAHDTISTLRAVREQANGAAERAEEAELEAAEELGEMAKALAEKLTAIEDVLIQTKAESGQDPINFTPMLDTQVGYLYRYVAGNYGAPTQAAYARFDDLEMQVASQEEALAAVLASDVPAFNAAVAEAGAGGIVIAR
ncbi:MAG: glycosyl hydrolase [Acidobacteria bacterium]|nr:glycosyl hydrolase [Acidobacteriota bacterium]